MSFLQNCWYVAAWSQDVGLGSLAPRQIVGKPVVLGRGEDGVLFALADICPHRYAPLSLGEMVTGGLIKCIYHGLRFDRSGQCVFNPHGSGKIPPRAKVTSYPVVERHSIAWIWMGDRPADPALIPDYSVFDGASPQSVSRRDSIRMQANYELIVENLLDLSRVSVLHDGILGNSETMQAKLRVVEEGDTLFVHREMPNVPVPGLFDLMYKRDGGRVDLWADIRWSAPGCLLNDTGVTEPGADRHSGTAIFGTHLLTPETETSTLYHFAAIRRNERSWGEPIDSEVRQKVSELRRYAFEKQDKLVIEAQQRVHATYGDTLRPPAFLESDAGPQRFRRILKTMKLREAGALQGLSRRASPEHPDPPGRRVR
jgi:vanillate O-demethylase monooxygenase subunit